MIRTFILAAVALLPLCIPVAGTEVPKDYNAETMLNFCTGQDRETHPDMQSFICTFRMQGVIAIMVENCMSRDDGFQPMPLMSASPPPSKAAARHALLKYMEANPDKWGEPWHHAVAFAIAEAFPCER